MLLYNLGNRSSSNCRGPAVGETAFHLMPKTIADANENSGNWQGPSFIIIAAVYRTSIATALSFDLCQLTFQLTGYNTCRFWLSSPVDREPAARCAKLMELPDGLVYTLIIYTRVCNMVESFTDTLNFSINQYILKKK